TAAVFGIAADAPDDAHASGGLHGPAGVTRQRQIEGAPPERNRAGPAAEPAPVLFEDQVDACQQTPEAMGPVRVIRSMNRVLGKGDGVVDLRWQGGDRGVDAQGMKAPDQLP